MKKEKIKNTLDTPNPRHFVEFGLAINYINNFIQEFPNVASRTIGGFLDINSVNTIFDEKKFNDPLKGIIFWHCFNQFNRKFPYHFAAFADKNDYETDLPNISPDPASSYLCNTFVHFYAEELNPGNLYSFLTGPNTDIDSLCTDIDYREVLIYNNNYRSNYPLSINGFAYNYPGYGFFIENAIGLRELIRNSGKTIVGVNYYFGLDIMNSRICLILFAVDSDQKNVIVNDDGTPAVILEKSYP